MPGRRASPPSYQGRRPLAHSGRPPFRHGRSRARMLYYRHSGALFPGTEAPMQTPYTSTIWAGHTLTWGQRTFVMGILNITPDSFSRDGLAAPGAGAADVVRAAVARAQRMGEAGAGLLASGGERPRPHPGGGP